MKKKGLWYYEMIRLGYNYRITDFQCSLGISQIKKLNRFIKKEKKLPAFMIMNFLIQTYLLSPKLEK